MQRISIKPRNNWQKAVENLGFGFHTTNIPYWNESAYYEFTEAEILKIEKVTNDLWEMCLQAVQHVIDNNLYSKFAIPDKFIPLIEKSWNDDWASIYGRFDLGMDELGNIKLLEFNADTPTSLFEAAVVQWFWLQDFDKAKDQFNSIHEKLIAYWAYLKQYLYSDKLYFTCNKESLEDLTTVEYMRDCAIQGKMETDLIYIDDIGWDSESNKFVDMDEKPIRQLFKLYPYEWLINEEFGDNILTETEHMFWIEPPWRMILSNKAILAVMYELFPDHPNILPCYYEKPFSMKNYVRKPILSREGSNIQVVKNGTVIEETVGEYGEEGFVYQELFEIPKFAGKTPVLGSWVVGQEAAGMGIRESDGTITGNTSCFVPHYFS